MDADTAKRIATERLPCRCGVKDGFGHEHVGDCPAWFRPAIASALLEAARMPTREQLHAIIYAAMPLRSDLADGTGGFNRDCYDVADAILAAWSKPQ